MSSHHYWVTFKSTIEPETPDQPHRRGFGLADEIWSGLRGEYTTESVDNWRDCGYSIAVAIDGRRVYLFLTSIDAPYADWALCCTSDVGWLGRLLGKGDGGQRRMLADVIDETSSREMCSGRFRNHCSFRRELISFASIGSVAKREFRRKPPRNR